MDQAVFDKSASREHADYTHVDYETLSYSEGTDDDSYTSAYDDSWSEEQRPCCSCSFFGGRDAAIMALLYGIFFMGCAAWQPFTSIFLQDAKDFDVKEIGFLASIPPLCSIVATVFFGWLSDVTRRHKTVLMLTIVLSAGTGVSLVVFNSIALVSLSMVRTWFPCAFPMNVMSSLKVVVAVDHSLYCRSSRLPWVA